MFSNSHNIGLNLQYCLSQNIYNSSSLERQAYFIVYLFV